MTLRWLPNWKVQACQQKTGRKSMTPRITEITNMAIKKQMTVTETAKLWKISQRWLKGCPLHRYKEACSKSVMDKPFIHLKISGCETLDCVTSSLTNEEKNHSRQWKHLQIAIVLCKDLRNEKSLFLRKTLMKTQIFCARLCCRLSWFFLHRHQSWAATRPWRAISLVSRRAQSIRTYRERAQTIIQRAKGKRQVGNMTMDRTKAKRDGWAAGGESERHEGQQSRFEGEMVKKKKKMDGTSCCPVAQNGNSVT